MKIVGGDSASVVWRSRPFTVYYWGRGGGGKGLGTGSGQCPTSLIDAYWFFRVADSIGISI